MLTTDIQLPIEIDKLNDILKSMEYYPPVYLVHTHAADAKPDSDLDILVTYAPGTSLFKVIDLQDELEAVTGNHVDLVSAKFIMPRFASTIESDLV